MIAERIDFRAVQCLAAGDFQAVLMLLDLRSHGPQIGRNRGNPVRLFHAEFFGVADFDAT